MLPLREDQLRVATFGLFSFTIPPSLLWMMLPSASKTIARESACGVVPLAPAPTTLSQAPAAKRETAPRLLAAASPDSQTMFGSVLSATMAPWISPCERKIGGFGMPSGVQVAP